MLTPECLAISSACRTETPYHNHDLVFEWTEDRLNAFSFCHGHSMLSICVLQTVTLRDVAVKCRTRLGSFWVQPVWLQLSRSPLALLPTTAPDRGRARCGGGSLDRGGGGRSMFGDGWWTKPGWRRAGRGRRSARRPRRRGRAPGTRNATTRTSAATELVASALDHATIAQECGDRAGQIVHGRHQLPGRPRLSEPAPLIQPLPAGDRPAEDARQLGLDPLEQGCVLLAEKRPGEPQDDQPAGERAAGIPQPGSSLEIKTNRVGSLPVQAGRCLRSIV